MNKVYNNYVSGSVLQVSECLEIILYNKSSFTERLSLYNLKDFYLKYLVGTSEKYTRLYREKAWNGNDPVPFEYKKTLSSGFNVIVYISNSSGSPIGYSEFVNTQGVGVTLGITVKIDRALKGELEIDIENQIAGKTLERQFQGREPYEYPTISEVMGKSYRNLFTSDIERLESDVYSFIIGSSGIVTKEGSWKLKVKKDVIIDSGLSHTNICFYNGSLVLAAWEGTVYKLYCLIGENDIIEGNTVNNIKRIEGRYYYDSEEKLRDLETGKIIVKTRKTQFVDFLDPHCTVYDLPTFYTSSTIFKYIPEINNIYLDLNNYLKSNPIVLHSKIGQWYILLLDCGGTEIYQAVSPTSVINMTEEDLSNAIFVGDQTMILYEEGDEDHSSYYLIYNTSGIELSTERARVVLENGRLDWKNGLIQFCFLDTEEDDTHFEEYFGDNGLVSIVYEYEDLSGSALKNYRRNIYPKGSGIPELIGSFGGLIFYKNNTKINYL